MGRMKTRTKLRWSSALLLSFSVSGVFLRVVQFDWISTNLSPDNKDFSATKSLPMLSGWQDHDGFSPEIVFRVGEIEIRK
jgi:hypothetical protein